MAGLDLFDYDFLVALSATTSGLVEGRKCIVALHWCVVDVRRRIVCDSCTFRVRPRVSLGGEKREDGELVPGALGEELTTVVQQVSLTQFNKFIYDRFISNNLSFRLVTMGKELLGDLLPHEAAHYCFKLVQHFQIYLNLQVAFERHFGAPGPTLEEMAILLNLHRESTGSEQEECLLIAHILCALLSVNKKLQRTRSRSPRTRARTRVVRLKGTPYATTEDDIRGFLRRCTVEKAIKVVDPFNRPTGDFIVKLASEEDVAIALSSHKEKLGGRYIEGSGYAVYESSERAMDQAIYNSGQAASAKLSSGHFYLKLRGMPFNVTIEELGLFFLQFGLRPSNIHLGAAYILHNSAGASTGEGFVVFESEAEAARALSLQGQLMGKRWIEVFPSDEQEFSLHFKEMQMQHAWTRALTAVQKNCAVRLRGLPFTIAGDEIDAFVRKFDVTAKEIIMGQDSMDRSNGEALIVVPTPEAKEKAVELLHRQHLRERYIEAYSLV